MAIGEMRPRTILGDFLAREIVRVNLTEKA
jgi:hypothetical protein